MKNRCALLMSVALFTAFAAPAAAQSLGDAARLEAERRAKLKEQGKVITTEDVKSDRPAPAPAAAGSTPAGAAAEKPAAEKDPKAATADKEDEAAAVRKMIRDKRPEEHWRARAKAIRDRLDGLRANAAAVEGRIDGLRTQLQSASGGQAAALASEIEQSTKELERFRREYAFIEEEWTRFEARAREAKIPASWIH